MSRQVRRVSKLLMLVFAVALVVSILPATTFASDPAAATLSAPAGKHGTTSIKWNGGPVTTDPIGLFENTVICADNLKAHCDMFDLTLASPDPAYWATHEGTVTIEIQWDNPADDFDLYVQDSATFNMVGGSAAT